MSNAIGLMGMTGMDRVLEIGSMRVATDDPGSAQDGASTHAWGAAGMNVISVDPDTANVAVARAACAGMPMVRVIEADVISYVNTLHRSPVDLLYLNCWDVGSPRAADKHLEAFLGAMRYLQRRSIVMIDSTDTDTNGKGRLVIPAAISRGFVQVWNGRTTLLFRSR